MQFFLIEINVEKKIKSFLNKKTPKSKIKSCGLQNSKNLLHNSLERKRNGLSDQIAMIKMCTLKIF